MVMGVGEERDGDGAGCQVFQKDQELYDFWVVIRCHSVLCYLVQECHCITHRLYLFQYHIIQNNLQLPWAAVVYREMQDINIVNK